MNGDMVDESKRAIIELFSELAKIHGFSKSLGEVYAIIFLSNKPLCLNDIMEELNMSKGNVSINLNKLEDLGLIKKVWIKGDRKNYYVVAKGFSSFKDLAKKKYNLILKTCDRLKELYETENMNEEEKKLINEKIKEIEKMRDVSKKILNILEEIE